MLLLLSDTTGLGVILLAGFAVALFVAVSFLPRVHTNISPCFWSTLSAPVVLAKRRARAWMFLIRGPKVIKDAFAKANGSPFFVDVPGNRYLIVSSWKHIKEIDAAPDSVLSLQGAAKEMLQPKYTMSNFDWLEKRGANGTPLIRTLRTLLTNHLPDILPEIRRSMSGLIDRLYDSHPVANGIKVPPLYPMVVQGVASSNAQAFFGHDLAKNEQFMKAALNFIEHTLLIAEILRLLPEILSGLIGKFLSAKLNSSHIIFNTLQPIAAECLDERDMAKLGHKVPEHKDCIQLVRKTRRDRSHGLQNVLFRSSSPCGSGRSISHRRRFALPFTISASIRISTRRKALQPFQLSGGFKVNAVEWVCTAAQGLTQDAAYCAKPDEFHGFRFAQPSVVENMAGAASSTSFQAPERRKSSGFTDIADWQLWGTGKCARPGRYYASAIMKTMIGQFITKYNMQLTHPNARRHFAWRTFIIHFPSTTVMLRPRESCTRRSYKSECEDRADSNRSGHKVFNVGYQEEE
ncbi:hypothetical protein MFIFM68171_04682 [Madurella fahalii]|uniref:Cytochrome P450 n=1 Tax=Madurella fahalii TaxID=1157608 RepID=A0ABQ0G9P6_9PEZI